MSDKCDYSMEKYGDNYCAIKKKSKSAMTSIRTSASVTIGIAALFIVSGRRTIDMEKENLPLLRLLGPSRHQARRRCHLLLREMSQALQGFHLIEERVRNNFRTRSSLS